MKFDVIVGNPPYLRNMHLDIIEMSVKLLTLNGVGVLIHPASWMLNEVPGPMIQTVVRTMNPHVIRSILFNGQQYFDLQNDAFGIPLSITFFQQEARKAPIQVEDRIRNVEYTATNISDMNKYAGDENYNGLKTKILNYISNNSSLRDHINPDQQYPWYVSLPQLSGNVNNLTGLPMSNFYTFFSRVKVVVTNHKPEQSSRCFGFNTEQEAKNFEQYLKTYFARFCFSIAKFDRTINKITLSTTPWLDWTRKWTDKDLFELFEVSEEVRTNLVYATIPQYYEI